MPAVGSGTAQAAAASCTAAVGAFLLWRGCRYFLYQQRLAPSNSASWLPVTATSKEELEEELMHLPTPIAFTSETAQKLVHLLTNKLSDYTRACPLAQRSMKECRARYGNTHPRTLTAIHNAAVVLMQSGRLEEALPLQQEALTGRKKVLGEKHIDTLDSLNRMALLYQQQGKEQQAVVIFNEVLDVLQPDYSTSDLLGSRGRSSGRRSSRFAAKRTGSADGKLRVSGGRHREYAGLTVAMHLAALLRHSGRPDNMSRAERLLRNSLYRARGLLGGSDPKTLIASNQLGQLLHKMGRPLAAAPLLRETLDGRLATLGDNHPQTFNAYGALASVMCDLNLPDQAASLLQRSTAVERCTEKLGADHRVTVALASKYDRAKELAAALVTPLHEREAAVKDAEGEGTYDLASLAASTEHQQVLPGVQRVHSQTPTDSVSDDFAFKASTAALLLVQCQNEYAEPGGLAHDDVREVLARNNMLNHCTALAASARAAGTLVVHAPVYFSTPGADIEAFAWGLRTESVNDMLVEGTWGADFNAPLAPQEGELVLSNLVGLDCCTPELLSALKGRGIKTLILVGFNPASVEASMRSAAEGGYQVVTVIDAIGFPSTEKERLARLHYPYASKAMPTTRLLPLFGLKTFPPQVRRALPASEFKQLVRGNDKALALEAADDWKKYNEVVSEQECRLHQSWLVDSLADLCVAFRVPGSERWQCRYLMLTRNMLKIYGAGAEAELLQIELNSVEHVTASPPLRDPPAVHVELQDGQVLSFSFKEISPRSPSNSQRHTVEPKSGGRKKTTARRVLQSIIPGLRRFDSSVNVDRYTVRDRWLTAIVNARADEREHKAAPTASGLGLEKIRAFEPAGLVSFDERYLLLKELGRGAQGSVWLARCLQSSIEVAVKQVETTGPESRYAREELAKELAIVRAVRHPNVVSVLNVFDSVSRLSMVMELLPGGDLFDHMNKRFDQQGVDVSAGFPEEEVRKIFRHALSGLAAVHAHNVVHRDIKPDNVLLVNDSAEDLKLADFGIAIKLRPGEKARGEAGTPGYMAPEILRGEPYDCAADIWSLGVVFFLLFSGGTHPCEHPQRTVHERLMRDGRWHYEPSEWKTVSDEAKAVVRAMLERDASSRATAEGVLQLPWFGRRGLSRGSTAVKAKEQ